MKRFFLFFIQLFLLLTFSNHIMAGTFMQPDLKDIQKQYDGEVKKLLMKAELLYSLDDIHKARDRVALEITTKLGKKDPVILSTLKGGLIITGLLVEKLNFPLEIDYIHCSRYHGNINAQDTMEWVASPKTPLNNRTVLIVDDVLDMGITLAKIVEYCKKHGAKEVYTVVLAEKERQRDKNGIKTADFKLFGVQDLFLIGYGLDFKQKLRNLPGIYVVKTN